MRAAVIMVSVTIAATLLLSALEWPYRPYYLSSDFLGFYAGSRALVEGWDPYDPEEFAAFFERAGAAGSPVLLRNTGYGYPLVTAIVTLPFALLPVAGAAALWFTAQLAAAVGSLALLSRQIFGRHFRRDITALLGLGAASQPAWLVALFGNVGGFLLALSALAIAALLRSRPFAAGALVGLLVVKPHPLLWFAPGLLLYTPAAARWRLLAGAAATALPLLLISFALKPDWLEGWLASVVYLQYLNQSRANAFGIAPASARWLGWALVAMVLAAFLVWRHRRRPSPAVLYAALIPLSLFASPYVWSYDFLVLLIPVALCLALVRDDAPAVRAAALVLLAAVTVLLPWLIYATAFALEEEKFGGLVPLMLLATLLFFDARWREVRRLELAAAPPPGSS